MSSSFVAVGDSLAGNVERSARPAAIIVGAGLMGRHHAQAAVAAGARIAAIVDLDRRAAASLAGSWRGRSPKPTLQTALQSTRADVAHICTPLSTHGAVATIAADAGLHALIEKPTASTGEETRRIHESFARNGKLACPAHQYAFQRSVSDATAWLARAGALRRITFDICSAGAANGLDPDEVVADILPHPLSMVQKLLPSAQIAALDWSCIRAAPGEWVITAAVESAVLVMQLSMGGRPTRFMTRITADAGSMELDNFHDFAVAWPGTVSRGAKSSSPSCAVASALPLPAGTSPRARRGVSSLIPACRRSSANFIERWRVRRAFRRRSRRSNRSRSRKLATGSSHWRPVADEITIIVVALIGGKALEECLRAVRSQSSNCLAVHRDGSIVDAGGRPVGVADRPDIPAKRRSAVELATTPLIALIEDTVVPGSGWTRAVAAALTRKQVVACGGPVIIADGLPAQTRALTLSEYGRYNERLAAGEVSALPGCNFAFRRDALLEAMRGSDGLVDIEVFRRLKHGGSIVWAPGMTVTFAVRFPRARGSRRGSTTAGSPPA